MTSVLPNMLSGIIDVHQNSLPEPKWGSSGREVYERTYSRVKEDGTNETWEDTVRRVVRGNTSLVPANRIEPGEADRLFDLIYNFKLLPAGRHLWMSGVEGRSYLFNCFVSGHTEKASDHFTFTFSQLLQGGGVGANYSNEFMAPYKIRNRVKLFIISNDSHRDFEKMAPMLDTHVPDSACVFPITDYVVEDSREGWVNCLKYLIDMATEDFSYENQNTAVVVLDMTDVRPLGEPIRGFGGTASGPVPLMEMLRKAEQIINGAVGRSLSSLEAMEIEHAIASCVVAGNVRRSARMSIKHWADEDIFDFISCKTDGMSHWSTNISVEIDDEFIEILNFTDRIDRRAEHAHNVYRAIVEGMLTNGEPGIWNSSLSNVGEPNVIRATNPCAEIALRGFENCNLGHVNLDAYVLADGTIDYPGVTEAHRLMTRFLIRATFGDITDPKTQKVNDENRRIGVGHFGFAGFLAKQSIFYSEVAKNSRIRAFFTYMADVVDDAALNYAKQLRIPVPVKTRTVAPTGTIAKLAGRTEGAHAPYAGYFIRRIRYGKSDSRQAVKVEEFREQGYSVVQDVYSKDTWVVEIPTREALIGELEDMGVSENYLQSQDQLSLDELLSVQEMYQTYWADNAVSFTVNVPAGKYSVDEVMDALRPYLSTLKGTTMMVDESRELAPYERISAEQYYAAKAKTEDASYDVQCASGACPVR